MDNDAKVGEMLCKSCGLVLSRLTLVENGQRTRRWGHPAEVFGPIDHKVVPVPYNEAYLVSVCDFCNEQVALDERQYLPVADFDLGLELTTPDGKKEYHLYKNRGGYACCPDCAPLVAANDWEGLAERRLTLRDEETMGPLEIIWADVRKNITGPVRPWQSGDQIVED